MTCENHRFYICKHCGNIIGMIHCSGVPVVCCGEKMTELVANTTDAAQEKHVPQISVEPCVAIGAEPKVTFMLTDDEKAVAAYAYCNLHSLWKAEIE